MDCNSFLELVVYWLDLIAVEDRLAVATRQIYVCDMFAAFYGWPPFAMVWVATAVGTLMLVWSTHWVLFSAL